MKEQLITVKKISETSISEIDIDLYEEICGVDYSDDDTKKHPEFINIWSNDYPISIERFITKLHSLQIEGATHVSMYFHQDHIGYEIEALQIRTANEVEIEEFKAKEKLLAKKRKKRDALYEQIRELQKELQKDLE